MTTNDVYRLPDDPAQVPGNGSVSAPLGGAAAGGETLTGPDIAAARPTTTPVPPVSDTDVSADLEMAVELADELATILDQHGTHRPEQGRGTDPARPAVEVRVDAGDVLARLGVDGWAEFDELDGRVRALHDLHGAHDERTLAAVRDRDAVDALSRQDEETYQQALVAAVREVAVERGLGVEVLPVRMASEGLAERAGADVDELLAAAIHRAVLPQLGRAPLGLTDDAVAGAVRAAGRTYLERIKGDERPAPAVGHDHLDEVLRAELRADDLLSERPAAEPEPGDAGPLHQYQG